MGTRYARVALAAALCAVALSACDREDTQRADRAGAEVGRKADQAMTATKDALTQAGHRAKQAFDEAGHRIDAATSTDKHPGATSPPPAAPARDDHADSGTR